MFNTIVVGVDGRPGGDDALALARRLASEDSRVIAVNAFPYEVHASRGSLVGYEEAMREDATASLAGWAPGEWLERRVVADISAGRALHFVADDVGADLIIVGACHRSRPGRVLLGDVSRATMHGATCPVAVAPHDYVRAATDFEVVGVGYDDGDPSRAALAVGAAIAEERGAELRVMTAVPHPTPVVAANAYTLDWTAVHRDNVEAAQTTLDRVTADLPVTVSTKTVDEVPGKVLVEESGDVDLLVVGSRGWGAVRSILLGSTADVLVHEAQCPLIVVPAATVVASDNGDAELAAAG